VDIRAAFCAAGYAYRPPRIYEESRLRASVIKAMERSRQIGLLSAAVSDIPGIEDLMAMIVERGGSFFCLISEGRDPDPGAP